VKIVAGEVDHIQRLDDIIRIINEDPTVKKTLVLVNSCKTADILDS